MARNGVIYARFSSHSQNEQSIEGQLRECYSYAEKENINIIGEYIDRAISGKTDDRPEFQRMIADSSKKKFDFVIVYQLDRFARNRFDSATYKAKLKANFVKLVSAREVITDDASGILVESILEGMAEYYSAELSQKIKRGQKLAVEKLQQPTGGHPYGYKVVNKKFAINGETAPAVQMMFELYASGMKIIEICKKLNKMGYRTTKGNEFSNSSVGKILTNKRYCGYYMWGDTVVKDGIPSIISEELFEEVQAKLQKNKQSPASSKAVEDEYLLTGKLFCGMCHNMMVGISGTSKQKRLHFYYTCKGKRAKTCDKKSVRKKWIEDLVIQECYKILTTDTIKRIADEVMKISEKEKKNSNYARIQKIIDSNQLKKEKLIKSLAVGLDNEEFQTMIYAQFNEIDAQNKQLEAQLFKEATLQDRLTREQIVEFLYRMAKGNMEDIKHKKTLINVLINKIYLYDGKLTIFFNAQNEEVEVDVSLLEEVEGGSYIEESSP